MAQPTTQLNATEQDTLVKQIGLALLRAAPRDWRRVTATYRAVGRYHELTGEVLLEDGSTQEWMATHDISTLFGRLRAGMYREGRGTWFNARYQLDHPSSYNLEYDRDEPRWDLMPPPQAYADELRMFPRSEDNVPEWLMRRMSGLTPEQPGPRFRLARIFDGHEPNGRPVLNRPELDADEQQKVLEYLNNAPVVRAERGFDLDRLAQQPAPTVPVAFHTDGVWIWPAAVNYYLQEYGVAPEAELVAHIAGAGYALPEVPEQAVQGAAGFLGRGAPPRPPRGVPEQAPPPRAVETAPEFEPRQEEPAEPREVEQPTTLTPVVNPDAGPPTMLVQPVGDTDQDEPPSWDAEPQDGPRGGQAPDQDGPETRTWDAREAFTDAPQEARGGRNWDQREADPRDWEGQEAVNAAAGVEPRGGWDAPEVRGGFGGQDGPDARGAGQDAPGWEAPENRGGREAYAGQDAPGWDGPENRSGQNGLEQRGGPDAPGAGRNAPGWEAPENRGGREAYAGQDAPGWDGPENHGGQNFPGQDGAGWEAPGARGAFAAQEAAGPEQRGWDGREALAGQEGQEPRGGWDGREAFSGQEAPDAPRGRETPDAPERGGWEAPETRGGREAFDGSDAPERGWEAPDARGGREAFTGQEAPDGRRGAFAGQEPRAGAFAGQERGRRQAPDPSPPTMIARPVAPPAQPAEPALDNLRSKLSDLGVTDSAYRIGEPAEHGWSLEKVDDGWRVGWYDEALTSPAVFGDAEDAAAFMLGKLLLSPGGRTSPPARPEMDATDVPLTQAQQREEPVEPPRHDLPQRALADRLDEPEGPPTMLAAPPVPPPPAAPPRREPPPRRVEPAAPAPVAAAPASAASGGGNQQWPIQPMQGEPPLTLFRGKEMRELPAGSELDRFGGPTGNLTYAAGTPFEERSLVPEWVSRPYHVYRVQRPIEALAGVAIPWFNQPGGGAAYLLPASIEELLATGDLIELDPGEPPID